MHTSSKNCTISLTTMQHTNNKATVACELRTRKGDALYTLSIHEYVIIMTHFSLC